MATTSLQGQASAGELPPGHAKSPIKLFVCDLNWSTFDRPYPHHNPSAPQDWASVDPQAYFDWHVQFGNNAVSCQAYAFAGYAFYPTRLGPVAPGNGADLVPRLYEITRSAGLPFWSYFCVGADLATSNIRDNWIVPGSRASDAFGFLAPESPWTDLLCDRIFEFLSQYPVDWLLFDWFVYGSLTPNYLVQPTWFVKEPFAQIIGRPMPDTAAEITAEENLRYKREVLARQFHRIKDTARQASPTTKLCFNVPYWQAREPLWVDHPMMNESHMLFAESSDDDVVEWLLDAKKTEQRVMTTIVGRLDGVCDPNSWRKWHDRGCEFFGYAWGTPPDFRPHPSYASNIEIVRNAFAEIA